MLKIISTKATPPRAGKTFRPTHPAGALFAGCMLCGQLRLKYRAFLPAMRRENAVRASRTIFPAGRPQGDNDIHMLLREKSLAIRSHRAFRAAAGPNQLHATQHVP